MTMVISKLKEKPKLKVTWWAMILGLLSLLSFPLFLTISLIAIPEVVAKTVDYGMWFGYVPPVLAITALAAGTIAHARGERSWALWVGVIPAVLVAALGLAAVIGDAFSGF